MAETARQLRLVRFGDFEVDLRSGELHKAGVKLKFGGQPFQVLTILLEQPGEVVTREELQKRLWPETFVDVDHNLNTAINKIREVLGDSADSPRFIETLSRRGYRFIGELKLPATPETPTEPNQRSHSRQMSLRIGAGILAISVFALGAVAVYRWFRRQTPQQSKTETALLNAVPFTAFPELETSPAFSPDESRIAFAWNGDAAPGSKGFDLYVKAIGSETLLRLTHHPSQSLHPAWSADGTQIAFSRLAGADIGIYVVPALGGPERKLRSTRIPWPISWSPDGKWIAFTDLLPDEDEPMIHLLSPLTLKERRIPNDPKCLAQSQPTFSHSGEYLAFVCFRSNDEIDLYALVLASGQAQKVSSFLGYVDGLTWSANDKALISFLGSGLPANQLTEITVANGSIRHLALKGSAEQPTVSSKGDKLAYVSVSNTVNIWRSDLRNPKSPAVELVPSTQDQENAAYSPDGTRIAFASDRSGVLGVWVSNVDGSNLVQISNPRDESGTPQWSPDGKTVAFDSRPVDRWEIQLADVLEGVPRKLITNISSMYRPHWSRDGKWIYFRSYEAGRAGVYRCPASGGDAIQLSKDISGFSPQESFDGRSIYFADVFSHQHTAVLKSIALPPEPDKESIVDGLPRLRSSELWTLVPGGIYFVPADAPRSLRYFDFASNQTRQIFEVDRNFGSGLSVSPDGRWILYSQIGDINKDIMLVDHFH
jgi:Tol biopolymer transport system component/DNA-binding winged helix-turn-helix (wHTH) protein